MKWRDFFQILDFKNKLQIYFAAVRLTTFARKRINML